MANIDLFMTKPSGDDMGGDIQLSAPRLDANGEEVVDLAFSYGPETVKQIVYARVRTQAPDWFLHPNMGGNLEDLIGEPNTKQTAQRGIKAITDALTYEDFLADGEFSVRAIPVNKNEILFVIQVNGFAEKVTVTIQFDYNYGMKLVG